MKKVYWKNFCLTPLVLACSVAVSPIGVAAELEEIIVSATKRETSIQDIPMSVEAISGEAMARQGIANFEDLSTIVPSFKVGNGASGSTISMRGMGTGANRAFEQSVAMFTDGVYMPRGRQYVIPFVDLERVEVLRGPQAVMFGLNATAGSLSVHSAKNQPGDEFHASIKVDYETKYQSTKTTLVTGGSVGEDLGVRLVYQNANGTEGYTENTVTGEDFGEVDNELVRLTAVWKPSENLKITTKFEDGKYHQDGGYGEFYGNALAAMATGDGELNHKTQGSNHPSDWVGLNSVDGPSSQADTTNITISADWLIGESTLTAVYGYSEFEWKTGFDIDALTWDGVFPDLPSTLDENYEQDTFEIRWASPIGEAFEYLAGMYFQNADADQKNPAFLKMLGSTQDITQSAPGTEFLGITNYIAMDQEMWSIFASGTWNLSDTTRIIAGMRHVDDSRAYDVLPNTYSFSPTFAGFDYEGAATSNKFSSQNTMPEVAVQWDLDDGTMMFAKVGTSAKSGGYATSGDAYKDETVVGFEFGVKAGLLDGAAELNATIFRNTFDDLQVAAFDTSGAVPVAVVNNAGTAVTQGIELYGRWAVNDWLTLSGSIAHLNAEFDEFSAGPCPNSGTSPSSDNGDGTCDLSGANMPYAADMSGNFDADIRRPLSDSIDFNAGLNLSYSDDYFTDGALHEAAIQDAYTKVGARIGLAASDGKWSVSLIGQNLSNEITTTTSQSYGGAYLGYAAAPRTIMLQAKFRLAD